MVSIVVDNDIIYEDDEDTTNGEWIDEMNL